MVVGALMWKNYLFLLVIINANICFSMDESKLQLHEQKIQNELLDQGLGDFYNRATKSSENQFAFKIGKDKKNWTIKGIFPNANENFQIPVIKSKFQFTEKYKVVLETALKPKEGVFDLEPLENFIVANHPLSAMALTENQKELMQEHINSCKKKSEQEFVNKQKKTFQQMRRGFFYFTVVVFFGLSSYVWRKR